MPELPEVEMVRRGLMQLVKGKKIQDVQVIYGGIVHAPSVEIFSEQLQNETIEGVERRGKFLIFKLTRYDLISHLRMEGKYSFHESGELLVGKHTHVVFHFTDGTQLRYTDVRKFGRMVLVEKDHALTHQSLQKLGPEPVEDKFCFSLFWEQLRKSKKSVKPLLLEQKLVVGLGNIYVDEVLWRAKIHPEQPANTLLEDEAVLLRQWIIDVLAQAIALGGTTVRTYQNAAGEAGRFQSKLNVYGRETQVCFRCGDWIQKIKVAGRGTHFCPMCQVFR